VGLAAADEAAGSGVALDAEGSAITRCCGEAVGIAADVPAVPAGSPRTAPASVLGPATVPWPDTSSAIATAATMSRSAADEAARAVRTLASFGQEPTASRSLARPAGRA